MLLQNSFFNKHFAWLHRIDDHTKLSGFCAHEMLLKISIMGVELKNNVDNWREIPEYINAARLLDELPHDVKDSTGELLQAGKETTSN